MQPGYGPTEPGAQGGAQDEIVRSTTQARQGVTGHNVRYVLGFGIAGVVILFALGYLAVSGYFGA
jgi:hypothetical protein